ncbi:MAG: single-stranded-DNA-specific exonuclease RecJ, partial [Planctomycetaceae bacterium]
MPRTWRFAPHDEAAVGDLCRELQIAPLAGQVLAARGYASGPAASAFLNPQLTDLHDPDTLPGVAEAADRIVAAVKAGRRITIYGDYDVDGMTAVSILWQCLKLEDAKVGYYIPCRLEEGYGLNADALRTLHEEDPDQLVVSVDCGITAIDEAKLAGDLNLELIITDHHQRKDALPAAACIVHPRLPGGSYPFGELCGAGVAFKLAWAICRRLGDGKNASPRMREFLKGAVGLAAIATVADVVPLLGENRVLVRYGLETLPQLAGPGLKALMQIAEVVKNGTPQADGDVGFKIAPRLNAAGRLGQARLAVELLTTHDPDRAMTLAKYLDQLNRNRRTVETRIVKRAKALVAENPDWENHNALVLAHHDWHPGVIGIVAGRIAEQFQKPAVMIALGGDSDVGQGSARTYGGVDLNAALRACSHRLESFGGHKAAAGLRMGDMLF